MKHYDPRTLFAFLEGTPPIEAGIEEHVAVCDVCSARLGEQRRVIETLRDPRTWEESPALSASAVRDMAAFAERVAVEDELAASRCDEVLTGPSAWWPQRLRTTDGTRTAGMVRQLLLRMRTHLGRAPKDALQVTAMAMSVAEALERAAYPPHYVDDLRGQALRDHAFVLAYLTRYTEALEHADRSARLLATVPLSDCERARLSLVRAAILRNTGEGDEAARLCREAGDTFLLFGERPRYVNARVTEGAVLYAMGAVEKALEIWTSVQDDPAVDELTAVALLHNVALCHADLGRPRHSIELLSRCIAHYEMLGMETERTRSRSALGKALLAAGHAHEAAEMLRQTARELDALGLVFEFGATALEAAEASIVAGRREDVAAICREVIARVTAAGVASQALAALAYLREVETSRPAVTLITAARESLRRASNEPRRLFATLDDRGER